MKLLLKVKKKLLKEQKILKDNIIKQANKIS